MRQLQIKSVFKDYKILFINNLSKTISSLNKKYNCHFLIDKNIWELYRKEFNLTNKTNSILIFNAVEKNKTLLEVNKYVEFLLQKKIQKGHKVVVIGGGIVQDMGSFASHIIKRGIDWIFIPTTLLSMVDSCIGAKSGINIGKYKNQVGSFHPPIEIYIYSKFVKTLSEQDIINGIGEIIKHSLIKGGRFYTTLESKLNKIKTNKKIVEDLIYDSLLIKKEIVEKDELEKNIRKLLNYGHTFGHALEGYTKNKIPHGLGVLIGVDMANYISMKRNLISKKTFDKIHKFIRSYIPVKAIPITDFNKYMDHLSKDKKVFGNEVFAILCKDVGNIKIVKTKLNNKLKNEIISYSKYFK